MEKEVLKKIFEFLEEKDNKRAPLKWKLINNIPLRKEDLNIYGGLDLSDLGITSLPEGLTIHRDLDLNTSKIEILPKGLEVWGDLDISLTNIESLPRGLKVHGDLYLNDSDLHRSIDYNDSSELESIVKKMVEPGFIKGNVIYDEEGENWLKSHI